MKHARLDYNPPSNGLQPAPTPPRDADVAELLKASTAVYLACEEVVAKDLSAHLLFAANEITALREQVALFRGQTGKGEEHF